MTAASAKRVDGSAVTRIHADNELLKDVERCENFQGYRLDSGSEETSNCWD